MPGKKMFKGGPVALNSGGYGPDDYLIRSVHPRNSRWTLVIFRWGRNWTGCKEAAESDRTAMKEILSRTEQTCVSDNARQFAKMKERGNVPTMDGSAFWAKYDV